MVEISQGSILDAIVASSSIPAIFHPFQKEKMQLIDGGILQRVPAMPLKEMGADVIVAVDVLGWRKASEKIPGTIGVLLETFDVLDNYRTREYKEAHEKEIDFWLEPKLGDMSQYAFKNLHFAYKKGYELGKEYAPAIKKKLLRGGIRERIKSIGKNR